MESNAYLIELIAGLILLAVGVRILRLAGRTRGRPEWLLGLYLALSGVSYVLYQLPLMIDLGDLYLPLTFAGRATFGTAVLFVLAFTRTVFRDGDAWSRWLCWGLSALVAAGIGVSAAIGDWEGYSPSNPWFLCEWAGYTLACLWVAVEGFIAYSGARKRARLGLCDPVVANRYLLWGIFGALEFAACTVVLPMNLEFEANQSFSAGADALLGGFEILGALAGWFVFFAPAAYRRWIARSHATAEAMGGA